MKLQIKHPATFLPERSYIFQVIFQEFLGIDFMTETHEDSNVHISVEDHNATLTVSDVLFQITFDNWLTESSLPQLPLSEWHMPDEFYGLNKSLPVIYGNAPFYRESGENIELGLDIFGGAFFMLTRYEELVKIIRDQHGRFPATASLAFQAGFLERPIVNEYVELLSKILIRLFPGLKRKPRQHRILLSHDVDVPYFTMGLSASQAVLVTASDLVKRRNLELALQRTSSVLRLGEKRYENDMYNTFNFIMSLSEKHGLQSAFYFVAGHSPGQFDVRYDVDHPRIRQLVRIISSRGHEIGLHTSYDTYKNPDKTRTEFDHLRNVAEQEGIEQTIRGGRQHYLRWRNPITWENWERAGLQYDSTLGFADYVGFRAGVCYEYPVFNLATRQTLNLRERPLIVMESTFTGKYMKAEWEAATEKICTLNAQCKQLGGDFTLLWHNSSLALRVQKYWYNQALACLTS